MRYIEISSTVPICDCIEAGYANPETHPGRFLEEVRRNVAWQIETHGLDLDDATQIVESAHARIRYVTPLLMRDFRSEPEAEVLDELWDQLAA